MKHQFTCMAWPQLRSSTRLPACLPASSRPHATYPTRCLQSRAGANSAWQSSHPPSMPLPFTSLRPAASSCPRWRHGCRRWRAGWSRRRRRSERCGRWRSKSRAKRWGPASGPAAKHQGHQLPAPAGQVGHQGWQDSSMQRPLDLAQPLTAHALLTACLQPPLAAAERSRDNAVVAALAALAFKKLVREPSKEAAPCRPFPPAGCPALGMPWLPRPQCACKSRAEGVVQPHDLAAVQPEQPALLRSPPRSLPTPAPAKCTRVCASSSNGRSTCRPCHQCRCSVSAACCTRCAWLRPPPGTPACLPACRSVSNMQ